MNARFWIFWNDDMIKVTLKPGQEINLATGGLCDEGFNRQHETYRLEGDYVTSSWLNEGRDCDGPHSQYGYVQCHVDQLQSKYNDYNKLNMPAWKKVSSGQRDIFAESMGY